MPCTSTGFSMPLCTTPATMASFHIHCQMMVTLSMLFSMVRFYLMPWLLGYSVMGMLSFPLESEFARGVANLVGYFAN